MLCGPFCQISFNQMAFNETGKLSRRTFVPTSELSYMTRPKHSQSDMQTPCAKAVLADHPTLISCYSNPRSHDKGVLALLGIFAVTGSTN
jgi:hypothetical protein